MYHGSAIQCLGTAQPGNIKVSTTTKIETSSEVKPRDFTNRGVKFGAVDNPEQEDFESASDMDEETLKSDYTEEKLPQNLSSDEKKQIEEIGLAAHLRYRIIEMKTKEDYERIKREAEIHCQSIQQVAIEEIAIEKRPSSEVTREYFEMVSKTTQVVDNQLKKLSSRIDSLLSELLEDFQKDVQKVLERPDERKACGSEVSLKRPSHIQNPLAFYFGLVVFIAVSSLLMRFFIM